MPGREDRSYEGHRSLNVTADTSEDSSAFGGRFLVFLANDGPNDATINVVDMLSSTGSTSDNSAFVLKPGEAIQSLPWHFGKIHYKTSSGTAKLRGLAVE